MSEEQDLDSKKPEQTETDNSKDEEGAVATATDESEATEEQDQGTAADGDQEADKSQENKKSAQIRVSKRIRKLTQTANDATASKDETAQQLLVANERIRIQELALNSKLPGGKAVSKPDHKTFDGGIHDPEYIEQLQEYSESTLEKRINEKVEAATKQIRQTNAEENVARDNEQKQRAHYRRVNENSNDDYEEAEDAAMEILGVQSVKVIIGRCDDSERILYRLGKDPDLCEQVADAITANDQVKTIRLLERASEAGFKVKPKKEPTPNPDTALSGGSPSALSSFEAKRLKMLKKSVDTQDPSVYVDFMDEQRKAEKQEKAKYLPW